MTIIDVGLNPNWITIGVFEGLIELGLKLELRGKWVLFLFICLFVEIIIEYYLGGLPVCWDDGDGGPNQPHDTGQDGIFSFLSFFFLNLTVKTDLSNIRYGLSLIY